MTSLKQIARDIFLSTLQECTVESAFARHVSFEGSVLQIGGGRYDLDRYSQVLTIAIGKAAHSMSESLCARIGDRAQGIIAAPHAAPRPLPGFEYYVGGHPLPNAASRKAGNKILQRLQSLDARSIVIYLISGGASAVVESPIDERITLADVTATYRALLHSGAPIAEMNAIRKHLSSTKGGRMAQAASPAAQVSLLVSDVPESALDALASGPTMPDSTTSDDCYEIARRYSLDGMLPKRVRQLFSDHGLRETPKRDDPAFSNAQWLTLLSSETAQAIAAKHAVAAGFTVSIDNDCDDWDYTDAAEHLLKSLGGLRNRSPRACIVSGGEVTVRIPAAAGSGGRNQQFALYSAEKIAGENSAVLSAGTDGIDGNSTAAGAVVDGTTWQRAGDEAARLALLHFDSAPLLRSLGESIETGPTGNNLRDLRILLSG